MKKSLNMVLLLNIALGFTIASNALVTPPANTSEAPNAHSPLGTNLAGVDDWSSELPFVDAFKVSRPWISQREGQAWGQGGSLHLNKAGWVTSLESGQYAETVMFNGIKGHYPKGKYVLLYNGEGTITFPNNSGTIVSQSKGRMVVDVTPQDDGIWLRLSATNPNDPIRNIKLIMPGFEKTYKTQPFHPLLLKRLSKFKSVRFMDWMKTNNTQLSKWSERSTTWMATQSSEKGVALEYMIQLANTLHADPWFTMPHMATDDYVRSFAKIVRDKLDPSLKAHIEYSNEVWNYGFSQTKYAEQQGLALGLESNAFQAALRYYSQRAVQTFKIWEQVFGGKERIVRVLASQASNPWVSEQVLTWKNAYKYADALAIAPYFYCGDANNPDKVDSTLQMSQDQILDACLNEIRTDTKRYVTDNSNLAKQYGVKLISYEGGGHLISSVMPADKEPQVTALFGNVNRNPRMKDVYLEYLNMWKNNGGGVFNNFTDISMYSKYGSWGALEYQDQDLSTAPKYQALMDFIEKNPTP